LYISDGNNNDPNSVGPSSSLRAAVAIVSSGEGKTGSCRTTGSAIPYNGQTFGEPLYNLDFQARSYANRSWKDKDRFPTFDEAWQACAKQCNHEQRCHTYTAFIFYDEPRDIHNCADCYLHDPYKSVYKLDNEVLPPMKNVHVSGVCRLNNK